MAKKAQVRRRKVPVQTTSTKKKTATKKKRPTRRTSTKKKGFWHKVKKFFKAK